MSVESVPDGMRVTRLHDPGPVSPLAKEEVPVANFITEQNFNFQLGHVIAHVASANRNLANRLSELNKAAWYLNREIERIKDALARD